MRRANPACQIKLIFHSVTKVKVEIFATHPFQFNFCFVFECAEFELMGQKNQIGLSHQERNSYNRRTLKSAHSQILIKKPTNDEKALFFCYSNFLNKIKFTRSRNRELDDLLKFVFVNIGITRKRNSCEFLLSCLCNNVLCILKQK